MKLVTEISPRALSSGEVVGEVFLADRLENGAGYATWLSQNLDQLMKSAETVAGEFRAHAVEGCDGSCYDCLRDYSNSAYHPLLDWFLAGEALGLLEGNALNLKGDPWRAAIESYAEAFGWDLAEDRAGARLLRSRRDDATLLVAHPLLRTRGTPAPILTELAASLGGSTIQVTDGYEIARRPGTVETKARARGLRSLGE